MAIGLNLSADTIRTATPSPQATTPVTPPVKEAPEKVEKVEKKEPTRETDELEKAAEREKAAPEEREIVSVSEDGDTVAVQKSNADELDEERQGTVIETGREDENKAANAATDERETEAIEAPEIEEDKAPEIQPMTLPDAAKETAKAQADEEADEKDYEQKIVSFAGYTNDQIEQMYLDGKISQYDYNKEIESREKRVENIQVSNEELSNNMNALDAAGRDVDNTGNAIAAATSDQASQTLTAQQKLDAIDTLKDREAAEKKNTEDTRIQWDYQLNA